MPASRPSISVIISAYRARYFRGSGSARIAFERGRSGKETGSSSPTIATSRAVFKRVGLPPTDVNTVARLTPAAAAMSSMDVAA